MNSRNSSQSIFTIFVALFVLFQFVGLTAVNGQPNQQSLASNADVICRLDPASTKTVAVTLQLNGVVFNDEGNYYPFISENHPEWDAYSTNDLYGTSHTLVPGLHPEVFWESARPDETQTIDPSCPPSDTCKGMVGWGLYTLIITPDGGSPITININTMDGYWKDNYLDDSFYEDIFYFEVYATNSVFYVRYWQHLQGQKWTYLQDNDEVKTTDLLYLNIEQDGLRYQDPYVPFNVDQTTYTYPLAKSIANNPYINVNVHVHETMNIDAPLTIDDYKNDAPVTFWFDAGKGINILAGGYLKVTGAHHGPDDYNVRFIPMVIRDDYPHASWAGIRVDISLSDDYFGTDFNGLLVQYAYYGLRISRGFVGRILRDVNITNSRFDSCMYAVTALGSNIHLDNTIIKGSQQSGLIIDDHIGRQQQYASDVENCVISETENGYNVSLHLRQKTTNYGLGVVLKNCVIKKSRFSGIYARHTTANVVNCVIDSNGYSFNGDNWTPGSYIHHGIHAHSSDIVVHRNMITNNVHRGLSIVEGTWGYGQPIDWDRTYQYPPYGGLNCFHSNTYSVYADNGNGNNVPRHPETQLNFGLELTGPVVLPPSGGQNTFEDPSSGHNAVARGNGIVLVNRNAWSPFSWLEQTGGQVYSSQPIFSNDSLNASCPLPAGSGLVDTSHSYAFSDTIAMDIYSHSCVGDFSLAYATAIGNIHYGLSGAAAPYYSNALAQAFLYAGRTAARDTLETYAFSPVNPGDTMNAVQYVFLFDLLKLDNQAGRHEDVMIDADTILQRTANGNDPYAVAIAKMAKSTIQYFVWGDSANKAMALATVEDLTSMYPSWEYPHLLLFDMTEDISAFSGYIPKTSHSVSAPEQTLPATITLAQNYPNPFNPNTQITFGIPEDGEVQLMVYDIMGREVAVLASGMHQAGEYVYPFNAGNLPSGVYVYKLRFGNTLLAKQMMLAK